MFTLARWMSRILFSALTPPGRAGVPWPSLQYLQPIGEQTLPACIAPQRDLMLPTSGIVKVRLTTRNPYYFQVFGPLKHE